MATFDLEEQQGELEGAVKLAEKIRQDLSCAESCESNYDFRANLVEALDACNELVDALEERVKAIE